MMKTRARVLDPSLRADAKADLRLSATLIPDGADIMQVVGLEWWTKMDG